MPHGRFQLSSSFIWLISCVWLIAITPIVYTSPSNVTPFQSSLPAGVPNNYERGISVAPLADSDRLMRGINMAWYTNTETREFTLSDDTVVEEDLTPYWFKIGFDRDILRADLDALETMGVRHIRISALIFQFVNWHNEFGSMGLNASVIATFNTFLEEVTNRGMILTVSFLGPLWSYAEHPSLMEYFRVFNETSGMEPVALISVGQAMVTFAEHYRTNDAIHTWELVGGFSRFINYLSNGTDGFGLVVDSTALFNLFESVANDIRSVDSEHSVTISDGWPLDYDSAWWSTGLVPINYDQRLVDVTDYIALCRYSDNITLNLAGLFNKPAVITEITSSQPYNHSRELNAEVLLKTYAEALEQGYSGFCPWEFSENIIVHEENDTLPNHLRHDWTWDSLLLFSLYRNNSVKFINTTNWYVLASEPQFDWAGRISFELFHRPEAVYTIPFGFEDEHRYDPASDGTIVTVLSRNLIFGDALIINKQVNSIGPLYNLTILDDYNHGTTFATIFDTGYVQETGIRIESNHTWEVMIDRYDDSEIMISMNSTGPAALEVKSGGFPIIAGTDYTVVFTDKNSGGTWQEIIQGDDNQTIRTVVNISSVTVRIVRSPDVLGMISLGMSISVIIISIVVFYFVDKRTPERT